MHAPVETFRSTVNTWECDENAHMNVQFYFRAFEQASEIFAVLGGGAVPALQRARVRHVRYHRELHAGRRFEISSAQIRSGEHTGLIAHWMRDSESGAVAATALDRPAIPFSGAAATVDPEPADPVLPRGIGPDPTTARETATLLASGQAITVHRAMLRREETDLQGEMLSSAIISRFTDGVPHLWAHLGMNSDWLDAHGLGRVAVEMKLTRLRPAAEGMPLALVSWPQEVGEKTMLLRHQLEILGSGEAVAAGEVRCLLLNLKTRRAAALPEMARQRFHALAPGSRHGS
jgi:acyl-CoA thioester hydrolase